MCHKVINCILLFINIIMNDKYTHCMHVSLPGKGFIFTPFSVVITNVGHITAVSPPTQTLLNDLIGSSPL